MGASASVVRNLQSSPFFFFSNVSNYYYHYFLYFIFYFFFFFIFFTSIFLMEFLSDSIVVVSTILVLVSTCVFPHLFLPCPVLSRTSYDTVEWKKRGVLPIL